VLRECMLWLAVDVDWWWPWQWVAVVASSAAAWRGEACSVDALVRSTP